MDQHLNLFFTYNRDNELIENNLTRAFIVTLRTLSKETRNIFLQNLNMIFSSIDFSNAEFELQNSNINKIKFRIKFIVTLSTHTGFYLESEYKSINKNSIKCILCNKIPNAKGNNFLLESILQGSVPDAWIYDGFGNQYCFLIECKKRGDIINYAQIIRHAYKHFGWDDLEEIDSKTIRLTWYNILSQYMEIWVNQTYQNEQEGFIINNFIEYLSFFGYYLFRGFNFVKLPSIGFQFLIIDKINVLFRFNDLKGVPRTILAKGSSKLFRFHKLKNKVNINF